LIAIAFSMSTKLKKRLYKLLIAAFIFMIALLFGEGNRIAFILSLIAYLIAGYDLILKFLRNLKGNFFFDEVFLMVVASCGAYILGEYLEGSAVIIFYQIGEWFQDYAVEKSRKSISNLMDIRPDIAHLLINEEIQDVDPEEIKVDDLIMVKAGERVPLDGVLIEGSANLDTSALTGESLPQNVKEDDDIYSGSINLDGLLKLKVTKVFEESTVNRILELVENALERKAKSENFISKFARYYTPFVVFAALFLALIIPLFLGNWSVWIYRALTFLVISCPCALVLSVPLSYFGGIGCASANGLLVKGGNYLDELCELDGLIMDKTGTLTKSQFKISEIKAYNASEDELLDTACALQRYSTHPIALALRKERNIEKDLIDYQELAGRGLRAVIDNELVLVGNYKLMQENNIACNKENSLGSDVYVAKAGRYLGYICVGDALKEEAKDVLNSLKSHLKHLIILSGDKEELVNKIGSELQVEAYGGLFPQQKLERIEAYCANGKYGYMGDGINDAPALSRANVGIAMGALGSDAAIEVADVVLMDDDLRKLNLLFKIAKKTHRIVIENIYFALLVKALILILSAFGITNMWLAIFADVGVSFLCVLNALRCLRV